MANKQAPKPATKTEAPANGNKTPCPFTLKEFADTASPLSVRIGDQLMAANVKAPFASGSFGWYAGGSMTLEVNGAPVKVQVGCNIVVANSKPE